MSESCLLDSPLCLNDVFVFQYFRIRNFIKKVRTDFWKLLESFKTKELMLQNPQNLNGNLQFLKEICIHRPSKSTKSQWKSPIPKGNLHPKTFKIPINILLPLEICIQRSKKSESQRAKITIYNNEKITKKPIPPKKRHYSGGLY